MAPRPVLGEVELEKVQSIVVDGDQVLVEHGVPALEGDFLQRVGRRASKINLRGFLAGSGVLDSLKNLRDKLRAAEPVSFVADIATATRVDQVLIEEMGVRELAGKPERFEYAFLLREFIPPPPAERELPPRPVIPPPPPVETGSLIVNVIVEGEPEFDFSLVSVTVEGAQEDGSALARRSLNNRIENRWTEEQFPPGDYRIVASVDEPSMTGSVNAQVRAGQEQEVTIVLRRDQQTNIAKAFIVHFHFDKAFVEPCMRQVLSKVVAYAQSHTDEKLVIVGHTDESGSSAYNQSLSERRSRSAYAFLTFGVGAGKRAAALSEWNNLRRSGSGLPRISDSWGAREYQYMLQDLGFYPANITGVHDAATDDAVRAFQSDKGLSVDGDMGEQTWPILIESYLQQDRFAIADDRFLRNAKESCDAGILKWLGCGEHFPVDSTPRGKCSEPAWRPNRRTELLFVRVESLPCEVPQPVTFNLPTPGAVNSAWCLGPGNAGSACCFLTFDTEQRDKLLVQPAEPDTVTVQGSIKFEDGSPLANAHYVLIAPDGEFMDGEKTCTPIKGLPIEGRTAVDGSFAYPDKPKEVGVYTLEIKGPYVARLDGEPIEKAKGNVVCMWFDGSSGFDVVVIAQPTSLEFVDAANIMTLLSRVRWGQEFKLRADIPGETRDEIMIEVDSYLIKR